MICMEILEDTEEPLLLGLGLLRNRRQDRARHARDLTEENTCEGQKYRGIGERRRQNTGRWDGPCGRRQAGRVLLEQSPTQHSPSLCHSYTECRWDRRAEIPYWARVVLMPLGQGQSSARTAKQERNFPVTLTPFRSRVAESGIHSLTLNNPSHITKVLSLCQQVLLSVPVSTDPALGSSQTMKVATIFKAL